MKIFLKRSIATLVLLIPMAAGCTLALAQTATKTQTATKQSAAPTATVSAADLKATSVKAEASIRESPTVSRAILDAVREKNTDKAKAILLKNGFTAKQLQGATIDFKDNTGSQGSAMKVKVSISASCCPATITITISF
jgi:Flp pilus assembly protein TadB